MSSPVFTGPTYNQYNNPKGTFEGDPPVWVHGTPVLTTAGYPLPLDTTPANLANLWALAQLLADSISTGMGIAAPQVDNSWQMFIFKNQIAYSEYTPGCTLPTTPPPQTDFPLVTNPALSAPVGQPWSIYSGYQVIINPVISSPSNALWQCADESCLSFPYYYNGSGHVSTVNPLTTTRLTEFTLSYYTFSFDKGASAPTGLVPMSYSCSVNNPKANPTLNWVLQHETDHVNGTVFTDRMSEATNTDKINAAWLQQIAAGHIPSTLDTMFGPPPGTFLAGGPLPASA